MLCYLGKLGKGALLMHLNNNFIKSTKLSFILFSFLNRITHLFFFWENYVLGVDGPQN